MPSRLQELRLFDILIDQMWLCKLATDLPSLTLCILDHVDIEGPATQSAQGASNLRSDISAVNRCYSPNNFMYLSISSVLFQNKTQVQVHGPALQILVFFGKVLLLLAGLL